jgi:hypothetical protein
VPNSTRWGSGRTRLDLKRRASLLVILATDPAGSGHRKQVVDHPGARLAGGEDVEPARRADRDQRRGCRFEGA